MMATIAFIIFIVQGALAFVHVVKAEKPPEALLSFIFGILFLVFGITGLLIR